MSWGSGVPSPYHVSTIALPKSGALVARQLNLEQINADNCPDNLPAFESEDRLWGGSAKDGSVWVMFTNDATDDANPAATPIPADSKAIRFFDLYPDLYAYDPVGKKYMVVFDPTDDSKPYTVRHCY